MAIEISTPYWIGGIILSIIISIVLTYSFQRRSLSKIREKIQEGSPEIKSQVMKIDDGFRNITMNLANLPRTDTVRIIQDDLEQIQTYVHTDVLDKIELQDQRLNMYELEYSKKFENAKVEFAKDGIEKVTSKAMEVIDEKSVSKDEFEKLRHRIESVIGSEIDNRKLDLLTKVFSQSAQLNVLNWQCRLIKLLKGGFAPDAELELLAQESIPQTKYKSFLKDLVDNQIAEEKQIKAFYVTPEGEWIYNYINDPNVLKGRIESFVKKEKQYQEYIENNLNLVDVDLVFQESQYDVDGYLFDILCRDKDGKPVIMELKYPVARRTSQWQISEYRRKYIESHGLQEARFVLISPTIDEDFKKDLERDNIEYREIPF